MKIRVILWFSYVVLQNKINLCIVKTKNEVFDIVICRPPLKSEQNSPAPVEVYPELNKILVRSTGSEKSTVKAFSFDKVFESEATQVSIVCIRFLHTLSTGDSCKFISSTRNEISHFSKSKRFNDVLGQQRGMKIETKFSQAH